MVKAQQQRRQEQRQQHQQQQLQQQQQRGGAQPLQTQPMQPPPFHLRVTRREAAKELQTAAKIGQAIRSQRIRDMRDLDEARREKQEWHARTVETLARIVNTEAWCEQFNDFVARILPEYAEFGMFVDLFEEEMRHRLARLQQFYKELLELPEVGPLQGSGAQRGFIGAAEQEGPLEGGLEDQADGAFEDDEVSDGDARGAQETGRRQIAAAAASNHDEEDDNDDEPQLETLYQPEEATMPQVQRQQQQLQQQQQGRAGQTVASSILHDPAERPRMSSSSSASSSSSKSQAAPAPQPSAPPAHGAPASPAAAGQQTRGALIVRTSSDDPAAQAIAQFMERLHLVVRVIDRTAPTPDSALLEQLNSQSGSRFILMLVDASSAGVTSGDDLFDLGCCVGRMGSERVYALHRGGDGSTDRYGVAHVVIDEGEGWHLTLARLLKKAGVNVDLNKLM